MTSSNDSKPAEQIQDTISNDAEAGPGRSRLFQVLGGSWVQTEAQWQDEWRSLQELSAEVDRLETAMSVSNKSSSGAPDASDLERESSYAVLSFNHKLTGLRQVLELPDTVACGGKDSRAFSQLRRGIQENSELCPRLEMKEWSKRTGCTELFGVLS
jgi:hypothetical protein